jgi:two-component system NtrC family sensor kinase
MTSGIERIGKGEYIRKNPADTPHSADAKNLTKLLSFRVFLLMLAVTATIFSIYTYINMRVQTEHLMESVLLSANRMSDVIKRSTRHSMLHNRREDIYRTIKTIADEPGIQGIRIYNKKGEITYSTASGEMHERVDMRAEACNACHSLEKPLEALPIGNRSRILTGSDGYRILGLINPIRNEPECFNAACHAHPASKKTLGVLDVRMSLKQVDEQLGENWKTVLLLSVVTILLVAATSGVFLYYVVHIPVQKLTEGTREIANGHLDHVILIRSSDEIGLLAKSFNRMTKDLKRAHDEITDWSNTLETKVKEKTEEIKKMQDQIVQVEKMASLGKLSLTVAHELNNPLSGILNYASLALKNLKKKTFTEEEKESTAKDLEIIQTETARCGNIVKNLLLFSRRLDTDHTKEQLHPIIENSIDLVAHHLRLQQVEVVRRFTVEDDTILCDPDQLKQAFIALLINATESMEKGGTIEVTTKRMLPEDGYQVRFRDTGSGIPEELLPRVFEPFFTTKIDGKGVGLGLSIVYGVIKRHGGTIQVESQEGEGTTFIIKLPRDGPSVHAAEGLS